MDRLNQSLEFNEENFKLLLKTFASFQAEFEDLQINHEDLQRKVDSDLGVGNERSKAGVASVWRNIQMSKDSVLETLDQFREETKSEIAELKTISKRQDEKLTTVRESQAAIPSALTEFRNELTTTRTDLTNAVSTAVSNTTTSLEKMESSFDVKTEEFSRASQLIERIKLDFYGDDSSQGMKMLLGALKTSADRFSELLNPADPKELSYADLRRQFNESSIRISTLQRIGGIFVTLFGTGGLAAFVISLTGGDTEETFRIQQLLAENKAQAEAIGKNSDHIGLLSERIFNIVSEDNSQ